MPGSRSRSGRTAFSCPTTAAGSSTGLVPAVHTIAAVREALGPDVSVLVDSGVRHGSDIAVALALGADACAIGRAYLYGLMAGGEAGVNRALDILAEQFKRTMQLLGVRSVAELRELGPSLLASRYVVPGSPLGHGPEELSR